MSSYLSGILRVPYLFIQPVLFCCETINKCRIKPPQEEDNYDRNSEREFKAKEQNFLQKHGIRKDLEIKNKIIPGMILSRYIGSNRGASATIYLDPEIKAIDPDTYTWCVKYEIGRISRNTFWQIPLWQTTVTGVSACVLQYFNQDLTPEQSSVPSATIRFFFLTVAIGCIGRLTADILNEKEIDTSINFVISNTTVEEQLAGRRQLKVMKESWNNTPNSRPYTTLLTSHIKKVEISLEKRFGQNLSEIDKRVDEQTKTKQLANLVEKRYREWSQTKR